MVWLTLLLETCFHGQIEGKHHCMHRRPPDNRLYATERFHRVFMVLFALAYAVLLPFIFTGATSWTARNYAPRRRWWPFTLLSLLAATISSACVLVVHVTRNTEGDLGQLLTAWALSCLVFFAVLLPHSIARFRVLQQTRGARRAMRQPQ